MNILIVEDNLSHLRITQYVLRHNNVEAAFFVVRDGQEALDFLYHKEQYADASTSPVPDLILLDLNLPKRDGREVLKIIKSEPSLKDIPVVIVSTSDRVEDVSYSQQTGAVAYISKSSGFDKFNQELAGVTKYVRAR